MLIDDLWGDSTEIRHFIDAEIISQRFSDEGMASVVLGEVEGEIAPVSEALNERLPVLCLKVVIVKPPPTGAREDEIIAIAASGMLHPE